MADREQAITRLKNFAEDMPASVIATRIDAAKKDRRWHQTEGCANATAVASREFCQGVDRLRGQLNVAAEAAVLRDKIERLDRSIENLRLAGAGQAGDAQSSALAIVFRTGQGTVQMGLSILLALVIESVCCFGLLVIVGGQRAKDTTLSTPEWSGKWLSERAEPGEGLRAEYTDLQADFATWARDRGAPRLRKWRFRRLLRAACAELKLELDGETVKGLRLLSTIKQLCPIGSRRRHGHVLRTSVHPPIADEIAAF